MRLEEGKMIKLRRFEMMGRIMYEATWDTAQERAKLCDFIGIVDSTFRSHLTLTREVAVMVEEEFETKEILTA